MNEDNISQQSTISAYYQYLTNKKIDSLTKQMNKYKNKKNISRKTLQNIAQSLIFVPPSENKSNQAIEEVPDIQIDDVINQQCEVKEQEEEESQQDILNILNEKYFEHLKGQCICTRCKCGKCRCPFLKYIQTFKLDQKTNYQMNFLMKKPLPNFSVISPENYMSRNQPLVVTTTTAKGDYQPIDVDKIRQPEMNFKPRPTPIKLEDPIYETSYSMNYQQFSKQLPPINQFKPLNTLNILPSMSIASRTSSIYGSSYDKKFEDCFSRVEMPKIRKNDSQLKGLISSEFNQATPSSAYKESYKKQLINQDNRSTSVAERSTYTRNRAYSGQYKSTNMNDYQSYSVEPCPTKDELVQLINIIQKRS